MASTRKVPLRQCTGCRQVKDKRTMIRVLKTPEGEVVLDLTGKKNGRGAYLCRDLECLKKARKNGGLERSLKEQIPDEVYGRLEEELGKANGRLYETGSGNDTAGAGQKSTEG